MFDQKTLNVHEIGYRGATACTAARISYRQLDYCTRTELVQPTVRSAAGSGSQALQRRMAGRADGSLTSILVKKILNV